MEENVTTVARADKPSDGAPSGPEESRSKTERFFGKTLIFMTIISFLFVGLIINLLQLILLFTLQLSNQPKWKNWHKRMNGHLIYVMFAPPISLLYCWSKIELNMQLDDLKLIEDAKKSLMGIMIPNHSFELDYMVCFVLADQLGNIGAYKSFSKDELKYLPIIGWSLWMSDIIFVKRDWKKDKLSIDSKLDRILDYDQALLGIFAEGTRWTEEKHQVAIEFAKSRNIQPFKYHLVPKQRGFVYTVRHYLLSPRGYEKPLRLFNLQIMLPVALNFRDFINGRKFKADVYCEEVFLTDEIRREISESKDEDDCHKLGQLLLDVFRRKDELVDQYRTNGNRFRPSSPTGGQFEFRRPISTIIVWILGLVVTHGGFFYLALTKFADSSAFWTILLGFIGSCSLMLRRIERESRAQRLNAQTKMSPHVGGEQVCRKSHEHSSPAC